MANVNLTGNSTSNGEKQNPFLRAIVLFFFAALAIVPIVMYGCSPEWDQWRAAAALEKYAKGESEIAIAELQEVAGHESADLGLQMRLAYLLCENGKADEALEICDRVIQSPHSVGAKPQLLQMRSHCLQRTGQYREALDSYKESLAKDSYRSVGDLNNLAYIRALAGRELEKAYDDIQLAIAERESRPIRAAATVDELIGEMVSKNSWVPISFRARTLVAAAIASRTLDQREDVIEVMAPYVDRLEQELHMLNNSVATRVYRMIQSEFPLGKSSEEKVAGDARSKQEAIRNELAILLTCRALLNQDLDQLRECNADRVRCVELGYDSDKVVKRLPEALDCLAVFDDAITMLDTRGYLVFRMAKRPAQYRGAKRDLDIAILAAQLNKKSFRSSMRNSTQISGDVRLAEMDADRTHAALLYHRMLINEKLNDVEGVKQDSRAIKELGFEPSPDLL